MRIGIVGSGFMGKIHAAAWHHTPATIVGVVSADRQDGERLAQQYSAQLFESLDALLPQVDVVDICTPTYLHHEMVLAAAKAGKHIVCEKPLALTEHDAREMLAAVDQAGVMLLVGHVVRFFPEYANAKSIVANGQIGTVAVTRLTRCSFKPTRDQADSWFQDETKSGGMMLDLMIHDFDYARWIAGDVKSVYARRVLPNFPQTPGDYALAILNHYNGAITHVEGGWIYPKPMFRTSLEIAGSHGLIEHPNGSSVPLGFYLHETTTSNADIAVPTSPLDRSPYAEQIHHFYDVLTGAESNPRISGKDAYEALCISLAAVESARSGKAVTIDSIKSAGAAS